MIINLKYNLKCNDNSEVINSESIKIKDNKRKATIWFLIIISIFLVHELFYLLYKKNPKFSNLSFLASIGLLFNVDNSIISRFYLCILNFVLILPISYDFFYNINPPSFYYFLLFFYVFVLIYSIISYINLKTSIFLFLSTILTFLIVFLCKRYYFTDIAII